MTIADKISWIQEEVYTQFGHLDKTNPVVIISRNLFGEISLNFPRIIIETVEGRIYWVFDNLRVRVITSGDIAYTDILFFDMDQNGVIQFG